MSCWKWFNNILEEAGVEVNEQNRDAIEAVIHEYVEDRSRYGTCSTGWKDAASEIDGHPESHSELVEKVRVAATQVIVSGN